MNTVDIILLVLCIPSLIAGISKGFLRQALGIASLLLGAWAAWKFNAPVGEFISGKMSSLEPAVVKIISYIVLFGLTIAALNFIARLLTKIISVATLGGLNRLLGALFGLFKAILVLSLAVTLFDNLNSHWHLVEQKTLCGSEVYIYLKDFSQKFFPYLKSLITKGNA